MRDDPEFERRRAAAIEWYSNPMFKNTSPDKAYWLGMIAEGEHSGYERGRDEVRKKCMDYLMLVGEELEENGKDLSEDAPIEGALRRRAGWLFSEVAQLLFTDQRSDEFDKRFNILKDEIEKAIGMNIEDAIAEIKELEKNDDE